VTRTSGCHSPGAQSQLETRHTDDALTNEPESTLHTSMGSGSIQRDLLAERTNPGQRSLQEVRIG
jgi:hypothetical protein